MPALEAARDAQLARSEQSEVTLRWVDGRPEGSDRQPLLPPPVCPAALLSRPPACPALMPACGAAARSPPARECREYYCRRAANQPSMEPASTAAQRPQPPQAVHFSPKHTYSAMHSFRAGHFPSPTKQLARHAAEEAGGCSPRGTIAAFRPGDPAVARSHSLRPQPASPARTKSYSQLAQPQPPHAHADCPAGLLSPGEACASPEPAPSELSTVRGVSKGSGLCL